MSGRPRPASASWFGTSTAERYDYLYSDGELRGLAGRVKDLAAKSKAKTVYLFFNNCHAGSAAKNARRFQGFLAERAAEPTG